MQYGSKTHGMHVITKIRPNSPAHKSEMGCCAFDALLTYISRDGCGNEVIFANLS